MFTARASGEGFLVSERIDTKKHLPGNCLVSWTYFGFETFSSLSRGNNEGNRLQSWLSTTKMSFVFCGPSKYRYLPKTFEIILGDVSPPRTSSNRGKAETWHSAAIWNIILVGKRRGCSMLLHSKSMILRPYRQCGEAVVLNWALGSFDSQITQIRKGFLHCLSQAAVWLVKGRASPQINEPLKLSVCAYMPMYFFVQNI